MSPVYTYRCDKGHEADVRADPSVMAIPCPKCILIAKRIPSWPFYINGETVAKG